MIIRRKHISELVETVLAATQSYNPPIKVEWIAQHYGLLVHKQEVEDDVSGYLLRNLQLGCAVIGVNNRHHPNRQRFTVAHELGHFLLHKGNEVHVDRGFQLKHRNNRSKDGNDLEEIEANLFASELLMPEKLISAEILRAHHLDVDLEEHVAKLAAKYEVSQQAMAIRLSRLGHLAV